MSEDHATETLTESTPPKRSCEACEWHDGTYCRKRPPTEYGTWPMTMADDWCSAYTKREAAAQS